MFVLISWSSVRLYQVSLYQEITVLALVALQPWYAQKIAPESATAASQAADTGQPVALTTGTDLLVTDAAVRKCSHKHKKDKKKHHRDKVMNMAKIKSVHELRAERQAREDMEKQRQNAVLHAHRGVARPR